MKLTKVLTALALAVALLVPRAAQTTTTSLASNDAAVVFTVTGTITGLPGQPPVVAFTCGQLSTVATKCDVLVGGLRLTFAAPDTTHIQLTLNSTQVNNITCTPVDAGTSVAPVSAATTCVGGTSGLTASQTVQAVFPLACSAGFGGLQPRFTIAWAAVGNC